MERGRHSRHDRRQDRRSRSRSPRRREGERRGDRYYPSRERERDYDTRESDRIKTEPRRCFICDDESHYANNCPKRGGGSKLQELGKRYALKELDIENLETVIKNLGRIPAMLTQVRDTKELEEFVEWKRRRQEEAEQERLARAIKKVIEEEKRSKRKRSASRDRSRSRSRSRTPEKPKRARKIGNVKEKEKVRKDVRRKTTKKASDAEYDSNDEGEVEDIEHGRGGKPNPEKAEAIDLPRILKDMEGSSDRKEFLRAWMAEFESQSDAVDALDLALKTKLNRGGTKGKVAITYVLEDLLRF
jgi:hypothetical protein